MDKKIPIIFSTVTGNAVKLANAAAEVCEHIGPYNINYILNPGQGSLSLIAEDIISKYDTLILVYWCDLGSADADTIRLIGKLKGKKLIILGTLGAAADSAHADKVRERVEALASAENKVVAHYLCQGSIDLARSKRKLTIPAGQFGHLNEEGFKRHLGTQEHPTAEEIDGARAAVKKALTEITEC